MTEVKTIDFISDPDEIVRAIERATLRLDRDATSSELVYHPWSQHSWYQDLTAKETGRLESPGHEDRLRTHAEQREMIRKDRNRRAAQHFRSSGLEYRVTPERTDGYGGYFAPPAWLDEWFATANRTGRVLSGLMRRFPLPQGVSSINVPVLSTGTTVQTAIDDNAVEDQDIVDSSAASNVVPLGGDADVALQLLEQSPPGAHLDWAIFTDLSEAYDYNLEQQLITGIGGTAATAPLLGVANVTSINTVNNTQTTGGGIWTAMAKVAAQVGDARLRPPEAWLMRTARWFYLEGAEDNSNRPFGLSTRFFLGSDDQTPDPISGIMGLPVFLDDAIPATLSGSPGSFGTGTQDIIVGLRPTDLIMCEGTPQTLIAREPLSGSLGVRLQLHCNAAAIVGRRPGGIGVVYGAGQAVQSGY